MFEMFSDYVFLANLLPKKKNGVPLKQRLLMELSVSSLQLWNESKLNYMKATTH